MSAEETFELMRGHRAGVACGVTWLPDSSPVNALEPERLVSVAEEMHLDFMFVDGERSGAAQACGALDRFGTVPVWTVSGVIGRVAAAQGWAEVIRASAGTPSSLVASLAEALHISLEAIREGVRAGCQAFVVADDLSSSAGWLVSPDFALDVAVPCYRNMAAEIAHGGGVVAFHSDGDIRALYGALARAGFSAVHLAGLNAEATAGSVSAARDVGLTPMAGISVGGIALQGAHEAGVRAAALAKAGSLLICDDGGMSTPEELALVGEAIAVARATLRSE
ncbi:MAG: hypothetical protein CVT67_08100 [Actinobacteria bacterium HGW-Actinobacteria-7]|nr:MAG: hypothetical protein CVT67_08100 [Actinobacteria bacterium HGW-Actinobacteria-7]